MNPNIAYLLSDKSRLVRRRFDESVRNHELTGPQARLLLVLERNPGLRQAFYAEELDIEPISLCRMVDRLEEGGWLTRVADPDDRRARLLQGTEKSKGIADGLRRTIEDMLEDLLSNLNDTERDDLTRLLEKVGASADQDKKAEVVNG